MQYRQYTYDYEYKIYIYTIYIIKERGEENPSIDPFRPFVTANCLNKKLPWTTRNLKVIRLKSCPKTRHITYRLSVRAVWDKPNARIFDPEFVCAHFKPTSPNVSISLRPLGYSVSDLFFPSCVRPKLSERCFEPDWDDQKWDTTIEPAGVLTRPRRNGSFPIVGVCGCFFTRVAE